MLPEVERYFVDRDKIQKEFDTWRQGCDDKQPPYSYVSGSEYPAWATQYHEEARKWNAKLNKAHHERCEKLRTETTDPMIPWMIDNLGDYTSYMDDVLQILPATIDQIEELANANNWCGEFDTFLGQAIATGVVKADPNTIDVSELVSWVSSEFEAWGRRYRKELQEMVGRIVEKAFAEHNEKMTVDIPAPESAHAS